MAYDIMADSNGRWLLSSTGDIVIKDDAERVAQQVQRRLGMIKGRYAFDISMGIPLLSEDGQGVPLAVYLSDKRIRDSTRKAILIATCMEVDGVSSVDSITVSTDTTTRRMTVNLTMTTSYGLVSVSAGV